MQGAPAGTQSLDNVLSVLPLPYVLHLISKLDRRDLGAFRAACRDGRALVDNNLKELEVAFLDRHKLLKRSDGDAGNGAAGDAVEAAQTSSWPALLARFPYCTSLCIRVALQEATGSQRDTYQRLLRLSTVDVGEELLGPFAMRPETTTRVTALSLCVDTGDAPCLVLRSSLPERLAALFPALTALRLEGDWSWAIALEAQLFRETLARCLPTIQLLHIGAREALSYFGRLPASQLAHLRELSLEARTAPGPVLGAKAMNSFVEAIAFAHLPSGRPPAGPDPAAVSATAAAALGSSFPQLRVLRLRGLPPGDGSLRNVLRAGLAPSLGRFEASDGNEDDGGGPYLSLVPPKGSSADDNSPHRGSGAAAVGPVCGGGGDGRCPRTWDVALGGSSCRRHGTATLAAVGEAVAAGELSVGRLVLPEADAQLSRDPALQRCRPKQLLVQRLVVCGDEEVEGLDEVLRRLGPPAVLYVARLERQESVARLEALAAAQLLGPTQLRRLELSGCPGLDSTGLVSLLAVLPCCQEAAVERCAALCTDAQLWELVSELLALPVPAERAGGGGGGAPQGCMLLRGRRLRLRLGLRLAGRGLQRATARALAPLAGYCTPEQEVGCVVSRLVLRVRGKGVEEELNAALGRGGVAARVEINFGSWQGAVQQQLSAGVGRV